MIVSLFWLLGSTVDTFLASVFVFGLMSNIFLREEGPRILKSIPRGLHSWLPQCALRGSAMKQAVCRMRRKGMMTTCVDWTSGLAS